MEIQNLPPNSHKYNEEKQLERRVEKVIAGEAKTRKRSLSRRFSDIFFDQDVGDIKSYLFIEVFVPAIKNLIMDMVNQGLGLKFYGNGRGYYAKPTQNNGQKTPYGSFYRTGGTQQPKPKPDYSRSSVNYEDIILESKSEAEEVLLKMNELVDAYGQATLADLYEAVGITSNWSDNSVGWFDLKNATHRRVREGYLLILPRPVSLK